MDPSFSKILIDLCIPAPKDPKLPETLALIAEKGSENVPRLQKQAARVVVGRTMAREKEKVLQVFQPDSPAAYLPIIFGHCEIATEFVMLNLSYGSEARISVGTDLILVETGTGSRFAKSFSSEPLPIEKILEILRLLLKKNIKKVTVELNHGLVDVGAISDYGFVDFLRMITQMVAGEYEEEYTSDADFIINCYVVCFDAWQW